MKCYVCKFDENDNKKKDYTGSLYRFVEIQSEHGFYTVEDGEQYNECLYACPVCGTVRK